MKVLFLGFLTLFSLSSFASCPEIDVLKVNGKVMRELLTNLELEKRQLMAMKLIQTVNSYSETSDACPDSVLFYHSFRAEKNQKNCSILTKFKISFDRTDINDFSILDVDCR